MHGSGVKIKHWRGHFSTITHPVHRSGPPGVSGLATEGGQNLAFRVLGDSHSKILAALHQASPFPHKASVPMLLAWLPLRSTVEPLPEMSIEDRERITNSPDVLFSSRDLMK